VWPSKLIELDVTGAKEATTLDVVAVNEPLREPVKFSVPEALLSSVIFKARLNVALLKSMGVDEAVVVMASMTGMELAPAPATSVKVTEAPPLGPALTETPGTFGVEV
jgi:hypothetical protein